MPASDEELYLTCSVCGSIHTISDAGDLELVEDKREGAKGINGIRTHTVGGDAWKQEKYLATEPKQYQVPAMMIALDKSSMRQSAAPPVEDKEYPEADPSVIEANTKDLKERNITTESNKPSPKAGASEVKKDSASKPKRTTKTKPTDSK